MNKNISSKKQTRKNLKKLYFSKQAKLVEMRTLSMIGKVAEHLNEDQKE